LKIDDPVAWFNAAPPKLVDQWIAYESHMADMRDKAAEPEMETPGKLLEKLNQAHG